MWDIQAVWTSQSGHGPVSYPADRTILPILLHMKGLPMTSPGGPDLPYPFRCYSSKIKQQISASTCSKCPTKYKLLLKDAVPISNIKDYFV